MLYIRYVILLLLCYVIIHGPKKWPLESLKKKIVAPHHFYLSTPALVHQTTLH